MNKKPDLIKLFELEGQITPRRIYDETPEDLGYKTPYQVCGEIHLLVDMLNITVLQQDVETSLKIIQAMTIRNAFLQERLFDIKTIISDHKKKKKDD